MTKMSNIEEILLRPEAEFMILPDHITSHAKIKKADDFAEKMHWGQNRNDKNLGSYPYITHPRMVAFILYKIGADEETIISGLLHDVVEDCECAIERIEQYFGNNIAINVSALTKDLSPTEGELLTKEKIVKANENTKLIKIIDTLCNLESIVKNFSRKSAIRWINKKIDLFDSMENGICESNKNIFNFTKSRLDSQIRKLELASPSIKAI